jgi:hypothetical protein
VDHNQIHQQARQLQWDQCRDEQLWSRPSTSLDDKARQFKSASSVDWVTRSRDNLGTIDTAVGVASVTKTRVAAILADAKAIVEACLRWKTWSGSNSNAKRRRETAVKELFKIAYQWYWTCYEANDQEDRCRNIIHQQGDLSLRNNYLFAFNRPGYRRGMVLQELYRGDFRTPQDIWDAGGFYPWVTTTDDFFPDYYSGNQKQMVSTTGDLNLARNASGAAKTFGGKSRAGLKYNDGTQVWDIKAFIYKFRKDDISIQCRNAPNLREVVFLSIPKRYIIEFKIIPKLTTFQETAWMDFDDITIPAVMQSIT